MIKNYLFEHSHICTFFSTKIIGGVRENLEGKFFLFLSLFLGIIFKKFASYPELALLL